MLDRINSINKVAFFLGISEVILKGMTRNDYLPKIREALDLCWNWYETKSPTGDDIYSLLDDGTEFGGLFIYMQMDQEKQNEKSWDAIIDALAYTNKEAYELNDEKFMPEPIVNVDDDLIAHFYHCYIDIDNEYETLIGHYIGFLAGNEALSKLDITNHLSL